MKLKLLLALALACVGVQSSRAAVEFRFYGGLAALLSGQNILDDEGAAVTDVDSLRAYSNFPQNYDPELTSAVVGTDTPNFLMSADGGLTSKSVGTLQFPQGDNEANNLGENYGAAASFIYYPRTSGSYEFFVSSDDGSELWISSNATRAGFGAAPNAMVPGNACCQPFVTDGVRNTGPMDLVAGEPRFMEILWMEGTGGDWFQLGQSRDGGPIEIVSLADCQRDLTVPKPTAAFEANAATSMFNIFPIPNANGITTQPANTTVLEAYEALIFVEFEFATAASVQWQISTDSGSTWTDIDDAKGTAISFDTSLDQSGNQYRAMVNGTPSNVATLTVDQDFIAPEVVSISGSGNPHGLLVEFSKLIDQASAETVGNYSVTGKTVASATVISDTSVILDIGDYTADPLTVTVSGVKDRTLAGNTVASTTITVEFRKSQGLTYLFYGNDSGANLDWWTDRGRLAPPGGFGPFNLNNTGSNEDIAAGVSGVLPFADTPNSGDINTPGTDSADNYHVLAFGYFVPSASGMHKFWITCDDPGELYLSTDENPANTTRIAFENNWNSRRGWVNREVLDATTDARDVNHISAGIDLTAGQRYYIEAAFSEGGGGDNFALGVTTDLAATEPVGGLPIAGDMLEPSFNTGTLTIATQPVDATVQEQLSTTLTVDVDSTGDTWPVSYQWMRNGVPINGANGSSLAVTGVLGGSGDNNGAKYSVSAYNLDGTFNLVTSEEATLTVVDDVDPPVLVSTGGSPTNESISLEFNERLDQGTAENAANYSVAIQGGGAALQIISATLVQNNLDQSFVVLETAPQAETTVYEVTVSGVTDLVGNAVEDPTGVFVAFEYGQGGLTFLFYEYAPTNLDFYDAGSRGFGPDGFPAGANPYVRPFDAGAAAARLSTTVPYAEFPNTGDIDTAPPGDVSNEYAGIMYGWVVPPQTGNYIFILACDDNGALYLSTDDTPANTSLIAMENNWNGVRAWENREITDATTDPPTRDVAHISGVQALTAGQPYYIEAIFSEGGGGDNIAIAWSFSADSEPVLPANGSPPIPGENLYSFIGKSVAPVVAFGIGDGAQRVRGDLSITITDGIGGPVDESTLVVTVNGAEVDVTFTRDGIVSTATIPLSEFGSFADIVVEVSGTAGGAPFGPETVSFKTDYKYDDVIKPGTRYIEVEDFNTNDASYPDRWIPGANGGPTGMQYSADAYAGLGATIGIDYNELSTSNSGDPTRDPGSVAYRYEALEANGANLGPEIQANLGGDNAVRVDNTGAQFTMVANYKFGWTSAGDWYTFTRDFNAGEYDLYARTHGEGTGTSSGHIDWVDDPASETPTLMPIGSYDGQVSGAWGTGAFYYVAAVEIPEDGVYSLRWTMDGGNHDFDYLAFVPKGDIDPPGNVSISLDAGTVTIAYESGTLEYATVPEGPYAPVDGAAPPSYDATGSPGYYRVAQ